MPGCGGRSEAPLHVRAGHSPGASWPLWGAEQHPGPTHSTAGAPPVETNTDVTGRHPVPSECHFSPSCNSGVPTHADPAGGAAPRSAGQGGERLKTSTAALGHLPWARLLGTEREIGQGKMPCWEGAGCTREGFLEAVKAELPGKGQWRAWEGHFQDGGWCLLKSPRPG